MGGFLRNFPRPVIFCSRCITFESVRWNGQIVQSEEVNNLIPYVDFITNCPEYEIGLGVPRETLRIVMVEGEERLLQRKTGRDVTEQIQQFTKEHLTQYENCDGFILKSKSPSSGLRNIPIYKNLEGSESIGTTSGFFSRELIAKYGSKPITEEGPLKNSLLFEEFLTKIFLSADFRTIQKQFTIDALIQFQTRNKLLLMSLNSSQQQNLGRIIGNHESYSFDRIYKAYNEGFAKILQENITYKKNINVLQHALGYFKDKIESIEKQFFQEELDAYREGTIPVSVPIHIMRNWIIRHNEPYLRLQTFFWPFPDELIARSQFYSNKEQKERRHLIHRKES